MASAEYALIATFSTVWEKHYGQKYYPSPKDFRHAKLFLECNDGRFVADEIVQRAENYLLLGEFYADNRHGFTAFVNNIGAFIELPKNIAARQNASAIDTGINKFLGVK